MVQYLSLKITFATSYEMDNLFKENIFDEIIALTKADSVRMRHIGNDRTATLLDEWCHYFHDMNEMMARMRTVVKGEFLESEQRKRLLQLHDEFNAISKRGHEIVRALRQIGYAAPKSEIGWTDKGDMPKDMNLDPNDPHC
jgi:hypothetical protein